MTPLDTLSVASPCPVKWSDMVGSGRVRFCGKCQLTVYDLSQLDSAEACSLVQRFEGQRLCVRFYRRRDGRVTTRECTLAAKLRRRMSPWIALGGVVAFALLLAVTVVDLFGDNIRRAFGQSTIGALAGDPVPAATERKAP